MFVSALPTPCHFHAPPVLCYKTSNVYTIEGFSGGESSHCDLMKYDADHFDRYLLTFSISV